MGESGPDPSDSPAVVTAEELSGGACTMFLKHPVADADLAPVSGYARGPVFLKNLHTPVDLLGFLECFLVFCGPSEFRGWLQQVPEGSHRVGAGEGVCHLIYQAKPPANISGRGGDGELSNIFVNFLAGLTVDMLISKPANCTVSCAN